MQDPQDMFRSCVCHHKCYLDVRAYLRTLSGNAPAQRQEKREFQNDREEWQKKVAPFASEAKNEVGMRVTAIGKTRAALHQFSEFDAQRRRGRKLELNLFWYCYFFRFNTREADCVKDL